MADKTENIYVAFDYNNITIVDPNKVIDGDGAVKERYVKQEELVMYANLECSVLPRTKLAVGTPQNLDSVQTTSIAEINFLNPGKKKFLNNEYTNEITGQNSLKGKAQNQTRIEKIDDAENKTSYIRQTSLNQTDNGLLGITSIQVRQGLDFTPIITIQLEDIRGRALFESGANSPYGSFFHLPYPPFYLTLKGYYGKAVKLTLMLSKFNARYDSISGNFKLQLDFYTYKYSVLVETPMGHVLAVPYMYPTSYTIDNTKGTSVTKSQTINSELGRQKVVEVYQEYISKKLIPENFPTLSIKDLYELLSRFIKDDLNSFIETNLEPLTDIDTYQRDLARYDGEVYSFGLDATRKIGSWYELYIDKTNFYTLNNGKKIYSIKRGYKPVEVESQLNSIITDFNNRLNNNKTVGQNSQGYKRKSKVPFGKTENIETQVVNKITLDTFKYKEEITEDDINPEQTYKDRRGVSEVSQEIQDYIKIQFKKDIEEKGVIPPNPATNKLDGTKKTITWFVFDGEGRFLSYIAQMKKQVESFKQEIEDDITNSLSDLLQEQQKIGFVPNIRNILAVFFANAEAFLRLMDDVHTKAWKKNKDQKRINAILGTQEPTADKQNNNEEIVYPWPQLVVKNEVDQKTTYELRYPGDKNLKEFVGAEDYDAWPEVQFVEEYIQALTERVTRDTTSNTINNEENDVRRASINAIEFPITNAVYFNQETVKFLYEIFERIKYVVYYSKINRGNPSILVNTISEIETTNIKESFSSSLPLNLLNNLQNLSITSSNYESVLKEISNTSSWPLWIRGRFVTNYIYNQTENSFGLKSKTEIGKIKTTPGVSLTNDTKEKLIEWLTGTTKNNKFDFTDTYPFTNQKWVKENLANSTTTSYEKVYKTRSTISFSPEYKTLTNFKDINNYNINRPITHFIFKTNVTDTIPTNGGLKTYYSNRVTEYDKQLVTEGNLYYSATYSGEVSFEQTTSILNTPYFVNAIQKGVELQKSKNPYPYIKSAYLFLNSLPLITGKEKLKSYSNPTQTEFDYIFATLKKYGALHKLPYAWILKVGSIWYRYQKYVEESVDILDDVWTNFDYIKSYDPITNDKKKEYNFSAGTTQYNVILENDVTTATTMNLGFYPKLFNDFAYFYLDKSIIKDTYLNADIQEAINKNGLNFTFSSDANIQYPKGVDNAITGRTIDVKSWSSYISAETNTLYLLPSVGNINQTKAECFLNSETSTSAKLKIEITGNTSVFNGSVRNFWLAPNFGYFDNQNVTKPSYESYIKEILPKEDKQQNFSINGDNKKYSKIEELFSIFDIEILNSFRDEFLNFSKPLINFATKLSESETLKYYNFQLLMRSMMKITTNTFGSANNTLVSQSANNTLVSQSANNTLVSQSANNTLPLNEISKLSETQATQINNTIKGFLEEDVYFVYGNPSNYNKRLFYSFSNLELTDKFKWEKYTTTTPNVFPLTPASTIQYKTELDTLKTYVGFSTINELNYNSNSYIFDFFIDFNVAFTEQNIKNFATIIKIYATQKLNQNQSNIINTNQALNTNLLIFQAILSDGKILDIIQDISNKTATIKQLGFPIVDKSYSNDRDLNFIKNDILQTPPINGTLTITEVTFEESNTFPITPNPLTNVGGSETFKTNMDNYLRVNEQSINEIIDDFWPRLTTMIGKIEKTEKKVNINQLDGDPQTKLELWETFKSLNDKWISGNDYKAKTLFEDVMLVDRASRNIGEKVLVDIFGLKDMIDPNKIMLTVDVLSFVQTIIEANGFVVMTLPSYVNFYGLQNVSADARPKPEGTLEFANTLFGTFLNVDYRESSSKLVCQFVDRPSQYVDLKDNVDFKFRDDAFDITQQSQNPFGEQAVNKNDYDKSNKVVGFNVDIGVQNQQIFKNFSVGQNSGLATSEALEILNQMANQGGHRNVATQNMSLYSVYKNRSYTCNLSMMGNALIQPTMYFNLRYVPMFSGPYMITEVNHSISPGEFSTDIVGVRQPITSLPILENFLQSLRTNLIKRIDETLQTNVKNSPQSKPSNIISEQSVAGVRDGNFANTQPTPECKPKVSQYANYTETPQATSQSTVTFSEMKVAILGSISNAGKAPNEKLAKVLFSYFFFQNDVENGFNANFNNYGGVDLLQYWGAKSQYFETKLEYFCKTTTNTTNTFGSANNTLVSQSANNTLVSQSANNTLPNETNTNNTSAESNKVKPMAVFGTLTLHTRFFVEWWGNDRLRSVDVTNTDENVVVESIAKFIINNRDPSKIIQPNDDSFFNKFKENQKTDYEKLISKIKKALVKYNAS